MSGIILSDNSNKSIDSRITTLQSRQPVHHAWTLTAPDFDVKPNVIQQCPCSGTLPSTVKVGDTFDCQINRCDNDACEIMPTKAQIIDIYTLPSGKQTCITAQAGTSFFTFVAPWSGGSSSSVDTVRGMGNASLDNIITNIVNPKSHSIWIVQGTSKVWSTLYSGGRPEITVTSDTTPNITPKNSNIPNVGQRILFNVLNLKPNEVLKYPAQLSATYLTTVIGKEYTNASNWSFTIAYRSALYTISMNNGTYSVISLSNGSAGPFTS